MDNGSCSCPGCSGRLVATPVQGRRQYLCTSCGGHVLTVAVLRALSPGTARELWCEDALAGAPLTCPFCLRAMQDKAFGDGRAALCRVCEAVYLDARAATAVSVQQETGTPSLASATARCPQCGAPAAMSADGCCRYCGTPLEAPMKVVVLAQPEGPVKPHHQLGGLLGAVLDQLGG